MTVVVDGPRVVRNSGSIPCTAMDVDRVTDCLVYDEFSTKRNGSREVQSPGVTEVDISLSLNHYRWVGGCVPTIRLLLLR